MSKSLYPPARASFWVTLLAVGSTAWAGTSFGAALKVVVHGPANEPISDAVVALYSPDRPSAKPIAGIIDQVNKQFTPQVTVLPVGSKVSFPNKDNIRHNVYSLSPPKKFELKLYSGTPSDPVIFDQTGVVVLGCNIHDTMLAYVYVTDASIYGKSNAAGEVVFPNVPDGAWEVRAWHPRLSGPEYRQSLNWRGESAPLTLRLDLTPPPSKAR